MLDHSSELQEMQSKTDDEAPPIEASPLSTSSSKNNHARYNVILMALALCVVFAAFNTTQAFMTTINKTLGYAVLPWIATWL